MPRLLTMRLTSDRELSELLTYAQRRELRGVTSDQDEAGEVAAMRL